MTHRTWSDNFFASMHPTWIKLFSMLNTHFHIFNRANLRAESEVCIMPTSSVHKKRFIQGLAVWSTLSIPWPFDLCKKGRESGFLEHSKSRHSNCYNNQTYSCSRTFLRDNLGFHREPTQDFTCSVISASKYSPPQERTSGICKCTFHASPLNT